MKILFDFTVSLVCLIVFSPLLLLLAILIRLFLGSPIIYMQQRAGLHGRSFVIFKFRTMNESCDMNGNLLSDEQRLTRFGQFLRSTSLDELPELWNVFIGDMSLVGPRPLLMEYLPLYSPEQARRHVVRPGITGWAQICGRNAITWEQKFKMDVWYVENRTFLLDLAILFKTFIKVLRRDGINQDGQATIEKFTGSNR